MENKLKNLPESMQSLIRSKDKLIAVQKAVIVVLAVFVILELIAIVYLGAQAKTIPYVLEIDSNGKASYYPDAIKMIQNWSPSTTSQVYFMQDYIKKLREVPTDSYVLAGNVADVCARTTTENGIRQLEGFYLNNNPVDRSEFSVVRVPTENIAVFEYQKGIWKLTWRETVYRKRDNKVTSDKTYEGLFKTAFYTPKNQSELERNPLGMYVIEFSVEETQNLM